MLMGIMLWAGSISLPSLLTAIMLSVAAIISLRMGIKMLGLWLIYRQLIMLASIATIPEDEVSN